MFEQNKVYMRALIVLLLGSFIFASCHSANHERPSAKYEEKKQALEEMERSSPLKFLKIEGSHHVNMLNQMVAEGEISNSATLVTFGNIEVQVSFIDKNGAVIEKDKSTIDDSVEPNSSINFKVKMNNVKGCNSVTIDITNAMPGK